MHVASHASALWAPQAVYLPTNVYWSQRHISSLLFARVLFKAADFETRKVCNKYQRDFIKIIDITCVDLNTLSGKSCKVFNTWRKNNRHVRTRTFLCMAWFYQIGLKSWKPAELIRKTPSTSVSFHQGKCVRHLRWSVYIPFDNYSLFRREKDEVFVNLRTRTGLEKLHIYFESVDADVLNW